MIVVDVETSGLDPRKHSIIEIGAVEFENPSNRFQAECRPWDGAEISDEALRINGAMRDELLRRPKSLKVAITEFSAWMLLVKERTFAGENPNFDIDMSQRSLDMFDVNNGRLGHRAVDMHSIASAHMMRKGKLPVRDRRIDLNADKIFVYTGLPEEPRPHKALNGALFETEALHRLIYSKPLLKEFEQYPLSEAVKSW